MIRFKDGSLVFAISLLVSMLTACGADGDGLPLSGPEQPSQDGEVPTGNAGFNGGLSGRLVTLSDGVPIQYDLTNGEVSNLPLTTLQSWLTNNGDLPYSSGGFFETGGDDAGGQYMQTISECLLYETYTLVAGGEGGTKYYESCVGIYDSSYNLVRAIRFERETLRLPPKLSPSGKYVARNNFLRHVCCDRSSWLELSSVAEAATIDSFEIDISSGSRYATSAESPLEWLPDDQLVYTVPSDNGVVVYKTQPASLEVASTITLPERYQGDVESLEVSPDGTKLLMEYSPKDGIGTSSVLLLDLKTKLITEPAIDPADIGTEPLGDNVRGKVFAPRWSPDGKWIMVESGLSTLTVGAGTAFATWPALYVVPAGKSRTVLTQDEPTEAVAIQLVRPDRTSEGPVLTWHSGSYYEWVN